MLRLENLVDPGRPLESDLAGELAARGNRRRLRVFLVVFIAALVVGLGYTYSRPAVYRAQAMIAVKAAADVQTVPGLATAGSATVTRTGSGAVGDGVKTEAGLLTSRPLIEAALASLHQQRADSPDFGADTVHATQAMLAAEAVPDTNYIRLTAIGPEPARLAAVLNALVDVYSRRMIENYTRSASSELESLRDELANLDQHLAEKRKALEDFRQSADIVSGERDENQILARVKGLSSSLNLANEKVAEAEGRVRSLRESLAAGKSVVRARDNPTLAALESRASQLRESLRENARSFTPQFMEMDPTLRGMRLRLADLEAQIVEQRGSSSRTTLTEAEDELEAARQVQRRLQQQLAEDRSAVHAFSRSFSAFKAMQEDLAQGEASRRGLSERLLRTESSEMSRKPSVQVIEAAAVPGEVWRPDYSRDAAISLGAAFALGLLAIGLSEVFNRPPRPSNAPVIMPQPWISVGAEVPQALAGGAGQPYLPQSAAAPPQLPAAVDAPRELTQAELGQLLQAMDAQDVSWAALVLCGATLSEIRGIAASDIDAGAGGIRLAGPSARTILFPAGLSGRLAAAPADAQGMADAAIGVPESDDECKRRLLCAAHDAGLDEPAEITPQTLRHTCIAYLVRQGLRFGDLDRVVGTLPADELAEYAALSPAGARKTLAQIDPLMPALRTLAPG